MKKLTLLIISVSLFCSCSQNMKNKKNVDNKTPIKSVVVDSSKIQKEKAIKLLDDVQVWVMKGVNGELSSKKVNKHVNPLMDEYFELMKKMKPTDTLEVHNYRIKLINKLIDLQMKQNR